MASLAGWTPVAGAYTGRRAEAPGEASSRAPRHMHAPWSATPPAVRGALFAHQSRRRSNSHVVTCEAVPGAAVDSSAARRAPLKLRTDPAATHKTGLDVWEGARLLTSYLTERSREQGGLAGVRVVEVGAGVGFVGMTLAQAGAEVVLTDGSEQVLEVLRANVQQNRAAFSVAPAVQRLRWGDAADLAAVADAAAPSGGFRLVVASECVYGDSAGAACTQLVATLVHLCGGREDAEVVMSYTLRPVRRSPASADYLCPVSFREVPFFQEAARHFNIREVKPGGAPKSSSVSMPMLLVLSPKPAPPPPPAASRDERPRWARWLK